MMTAHLPRQTGLLATVLLLSACALVPTGPGRLTPNPEAIVSSQQNGNATVVTYTTALMNRAEAEAYAQEQCEADGQTLDVLRHPPRAPGSTTTVTFTCRRPFT